MKHINIAVDLLEPQIAPHSGTNIFVRKMQGDVIFSHISYQSRCTPEISNARSDLLDSSGSYNTCFEIQSRKV
jgi:hypothetical protein